MRRIDLTLAAACLVLAASGCAASAPAERTARLDAFAPAGADSLETAQYELIFMETHGRLMREIEPGAPTKLDRTTLLEIESIVEIAEEIYLQGNILLAIKLLTEAEMLLRQTP